jgi:hypothetical protein
MQKVNGIVGGWALGAVLISGVGSSPVLAGSADPAAGGEASTPTRPAAWPGGLAPELQRIQQDLGGSAVDRFEALKETSSDAWATDAEPRPAARAAERRPSAITPSGRATPAPWVGRPQIDTLRDAAGQLDALANRLEQLELYREADALRDQAQRFRVEARRMAGDRTQAAGMPTPSLNRPRPAPYDAPQRDSSQPQPLWNPPGVPPMYAAPSLGPAPSATPPRADEPKPEPTASDPPATSPPATSAIEPLEPTPLPENRQPPEVKPTPLRE